MDYDYSVPDYEETQEEIGEEDMDFAQDDLDAEAEYFEGATQEMEHIPSSPAPVAEDDIFEEMMEENGGGTFSDEEIFAGAGYSAQITGDVDPEVTVTDTKEENLMVMSTGHCEETMSEKWGLESEESEILVANVSGTLNSVCQSNLDQVTDGGNDELESASMDAEFELTQSQEPVPHEGEGSVGAEAEGGAGASPTEMEEPSLRDDSNADSKKRKPAQTSAEESKESLLATDSAKKQRMDALEVSSTLVEHSESQTEIALTAGQEEAAETSNALCTRAESESEMEKKNQREVELQDKLRLESLGHRSSQCQSPPETYREDDEDLIDLRKYAAMRDSGGLKALEETASAGSGHNTILESLRSFEKEMQTFADDNDDDIVREAFDDVDPKDREESEGRWGFVMVKQQRIHERKVKRDKFRSMFDSERVSGGEDRESDSSRPQRKVPEQSAPDMAATRFLFKRPPTDSSTSLTVTLTDGQRYFLQGSRRRVRPQSDRNASEPSKRDALHTTASERQESSLLKEPVKDLIERMRRELAEEQLLGASEGSQQNKDNLVRQASFHNLRDPDAHKLWVDKYSPTRFTDLLSDGKINRDVLSWFKQWNRFVFNSKKNIPSTQNTTLGSTVFEGPTSQHGMGFGFKEGTSGRKDSESGDPRPQHKVLLLCGPAGLGKTTLAHVCAEQAGYQVVEVNASDDRSGQSLKSRIIAAMEMRSVFRDKRPNAIILDEIDGAMNGGEGRSAISAVLEIINAPLNLPSEGDKDKQGSAKRKKRHHPLTRPLICICNDPYAAVLRPLRKIAKVLTFTPTDVSRLVQRLKVVCRSEGVLIHPSALSALCTSSNRDIRFCLNSLQFLHNQTRRTSSKNESVRMLSTSDILNSEKDRTTGLFDIWRLIFQEPRRLPFLASSADPTNKDKALATPIQASASDNANSLSETAPDKRASQKSASATAKNSVNSKNNKKNKNNSNLLFEVICGSADLQKILVGIHENMLGIRYSDPTLTRTSSSLDWLCFADQCLTRAHSEQQFVFNHKQRVNILWSFLDAPQSLSQVHRRNFTIAAMDFVPLFTSIVLSSKIRNVPSLTLLNQEEKGVLDQLVRMFVHLGLTFQPTMKDTFTRTFHLEPAIDQLSCFKDLPSTLDRQGGLSDQAKALVAHQVEIESVRRAAERFNPKSVQDEASSGAPKDNPLSTEESSTDLPEEDKENATKEPKDPKRAKTWAERNVLNAKDIKIDEAKEERLKNCSFFGYFVREEKEHAGTTATCQKENEFRRGVRYKFQAGFTNAVRRKVSIQEFL